jgi:hypothetical protein
MGHSLGKGIASAPRRLTINKQARAALVRNFIAGLLVTSALKLR